MITAYGSITNPNYIPTSNSGIRYVLSDMFGPHLKMDEIKQISGDSHIFNWLVSLTATLFEYYIFSHTSYTDTVLSGIDC